MVVALELMVEKFELKWTGWWGNFDASGRVEDLPTI